MSADTDLRAELLAHAPLLALVGAPNRIAFDKVAQNTARPFVVLVRDEPIEEYTTLDGRRVAALLQFQMQCVGDTRAQAEEVADEVEAALRASTREPEGIPCSGRSAGADPDLDLEIVNLTVEWWDGA
jgi:hypothetical protein